jgi:hypothetical protein
VRSQRALAVAAVAATVLAIPSSAAAGRFTADDRETILVSRATDGGFPNGASRNAAISQDRQRASYAAFESDATNIVAGDTNGATDVFLVPRAGDFGLEGGPWRPGGARLVSRAYDGRPANGPSTQPDLDGDQIHPASCVAFVSAASNIVRGDTNGVPDAFVYDLRTRRTRRVSLTSRGGQANGATYEVEVDGSCTRVAFVSDASNLARRTRRGTKQVYVRVDGVTLLASASNGGRPGNADSSGIAFSKLGGAPGCTRSCGAKLGEAVAFESNASNLAPRDRNGATDVFVRSFARVRGKLRPRTTLVSRTRGGRAGNGPSSQPDIGDNGAFVAYRTEATDLLPGDRNGVADVARANAQAPGRSVWVSRSQAVGAGGNNHSGRPTITRSGSMTFFESAASNLQSNVRAGGFFDRNETGDIFFWAVVSGNVSLQSRDSDHEILNNPPEHVDPDHRPHAPALRPASSYYGNYVLWESAYPLVDLNVARQAFPGLAPRAAAERSTSEPALNQVYLRYIGPA